MAICNLQQFLASCFTQDFSLPMPIMKYVWMNPSSPNVYQKLVQTCKVFFIKNPILVMQNVLFKEEGWGEEKIWKYCSRNDCDFYKCNHDRKEICIEKMDCLFWLTESFVIISSQGRLSYFASFFVSKIYQNDAECVELFNQDIFYDELEFLSIDPNKFNLYFCSITYRNGDFVSLEDIFKLFLNKASFLMYVLYPANGICKNYNELANICNTIERVELYCLPEEFSIMKFYQLLKKNKHRFGLCIYASLESHQSDIDEINEEILQTESFDFVPPLLFSYNTDLETRNKMGRILKKEFRKRNNYALKTGHAHNRF